MTATITVTAVDPVARYAATTAAQQPSIDRTGELAECGSATGLCGADSQGCDGLGTAGFLSTTLINTGTDTGP